MVWGFESPPAHHRKKNTSFPLATGAGRRFHFGDNHMTVTVETLDKLERKITLNLPCSL